MSTEPKRGACRHLNVIGHEWSSTCQDCGQTWKHLVPEPTIGTFNIVGGREVESAPAQPCRECVTHVIAGASWIPCALPEGHEGGHRGKGTCFKHGEYFGEFGAFPQCPKWPDCIADGIGHVTRGDVRKCLSGDHSECESVPPAAETAKPDIEIISANVHDSWIFEKRAQGFHGPEDVCPVTKLLPRERFGCCKKYHADMIPYAELTEAKKELDHTTVRTVLKAINESARRQT